TTQEEVSAEKSRKSLGAQVLGLDQGDSQEGEVLVGIELESGANQALQRCRRQRIRQDERPPEECLDIERVGLESCEHLHKYSALSARVVDLHRSAGKRDDRLSAPA